MDQQLSIIEYNKIVELINREHKSFAKNKKARIKRKILSYEKLVQTLKFHGSDGKDLVCQVGDLSIYDYGAKELINRREKSIRLRNYIFHRIVSWGRINDLILVEFRLKNI